MFNYVFMPGSLLLVDDEKPLLALLSRYLERLGYQVESCESGWEALRLCHDSKRRYDVVVLDLGLPDMPGLEVLNAVLASNENLRVLVSSGTPFSPEFLPPSQRARVGSLLKPFVPKMLDAALRNLV